MVLLSLLSVVSACMAFASAATLTQVDHFGYNPTNATMYIYVPDNLPRHPTVILGIHWCHGSAIDYYKGTQWAKLADTKGFIVIYPNTPNTFDYCWDVASKQTLTHDGGGDSQAIANMVRYTIAKYRANRSKVFVTGISSGAMMTNVMAAVYPDMFAAGSVYAGVAAGCFSGPEVDYWNNECATGQIIKTGKQWAADARAMNRGYHGRYPRMQLWHGSVDDILFPQNLVEEVKQWTTLLGVSHVRPKTTENSPLEGYTRVNYGHKVESILLDGVGHNLPGNEAETMKWFGI